MPLPTLRALGEKAARKHRGTTNMGAPGAASAYQPTNWARVAASCAPQPGNSSSRILVTGAAGFIGMHVAIALRSRGGGVVGLDNFNDHYAVALKRARQLHALSFGAYTVDGDITDPKLLDRLFAACRFTHVVHLAAQAGVRPGPAGSAPYVHANLAGQVAVLEAVARRSPPPALVFASSSSVYGLSQHRPFSERDPADRPASLYAATKRADELLAHAYRHVHRLHVTALRFFTVYGPWGRPDMAALTFASALLRGDPVRVFRGSRGQELSRDFTYIDDITAGVLAAVDTSPSSSAGNGDGGGSGISERGGGSEGDSGNSDGGGSGGGGAVSAEGGSFRVYNLGSTRTATVEELLGLLEAQLGAKAWRAEAVETPAGDVVATWANITLAQQELGYRPKVALEDGVRAMCDWLLQFYSTKDEE